MKGDRAGQGREGQGKEGVSSCPMVVNAISARDEAFRVPLSRLAGYFANDDVSLQYIRILYATFCDRLCVLE